jgi:hypothetical protein
MAPTTFMTAPGFFSVTLLMYGQSRMSKKINYFFLPTVESSTLLLAFASEIILISRPFGTHQQIFVRSLTTCVF